MAGYKCDNCGIIKDTSELHHWNLDGEIICKQCQDHHDKDVAQIQADIKDQQTNPNFRMA